MKIIMVTDDDDDHSHFSFGDGILGSWELLLLGFIKGGYYYYYIAMYDESEKSSFP